MAKSESEAAHIANLQRELAPFVVTRVLDGEKVPAFECELCGTISDARNGPEEATHSFGCMLNRERHPQRDRHGFAR